MAHRLVKKELERFALTVYFVPDPHFGEYSVNGTPTLIALGSSGQVRKAGYQSPQELLEWLQGIK